MAIKRIGAIDALELDQEAPALACPRHRPHFDRQGDPARSLEEGRLRRRRRAVAQPEIDIAAKQAAGIAVKPGDQGQRQRADAGNGADTERQTKNEDPETGNPAPEFAKGKTDAQWRLHDRIPRARNRQARSGRQDGDHRGGGIVAEPAAGVFRQPDPRALALPGARAAAQLVRQFHQLGATRGPHGMAPAQ